DGRAGCGQGDDGPAAAAVEHRPADPEERDRPVDDDGAGVATAVNLDRVAGPGRCQRLGNRPVGAVRRDDEDGAEQERPEEGAEDGHAGCPFSAVASSAWHWASTSGL